MTVFAPPAARMPMIWPPAPDGSLTNSDTLALGHAAAAAVSIASPSVRLPGGSRALSTPPVSLQFTETDWTSLPLAPGGLELAVIFNWLAWGRALNTLVTSSMEMTFEALIPP